MSEVTQAVPAMIRCTSSDTDSNSTEYAHQHNLTHHAKHLVIVRFPFKPDLQM